VPRVRRLRGRRKRPAALLACSELALLVRLMADDKEATRSYAAACMQNVTSLVDQLDASARVGNSSGLDMERAFPGWVQPAV